MATAFKVHLAPSASDIPSLPQTEEAAQTATRLLQTDLEQHHIFFNDHRFHNHIPHLLFSFFATGASPAVMQREYARDASYQRPLGAVDKTVVQALHTDYDAAIFRSIGVAEHYASLIQFYQEKIDELGWKQVLLQYIFNETPSAIKLMHCLFSGLVHPLIELMYGLEFAQPAIIGQALAQAVVQGDDFSSLFAKVDAQKGSLPQQSVVDLLETVHTDQPGLVAAATPPDRYDIFSITSRAPDALAAYLARIKVNEDLEEALDEMIHIHAYTVLAAAFKAGRKPKLDFFLVHHHNCASLLQYLNENRDWIPRASLIRLIQFAQRLHVIDYISLCAPPLALDTLRGYTPRDAASGNVASTPKDLLPHFHEAADDAHIIKAVRGLFIAEKAAAKYTERAEQPSWLRIKDKQTWLNMHYVLLDSIENRAPGERAFVFHAGYDESWAAFPKLEDASKL